MSITEYIVHMVWLYLKEGSLHGLRMLVYPTSLQLARKLWLILILFIFMYSNYVIYYLSTSYFEQPLEVRINPDRVPTVSIELPAIAICPANKISKKKLLNFSKKLFSYQQQFSPNLLGKTSNELADRIILLGGFFLYPYWREDYTSTEMRNLHKLLNAYAQNLQNMTTYSVEDLLYEMSPDCEEYVLEGMIFDRALNISEDLDKRITTTGACCIFNYKRNSTSYNPIIRDKQNTIAAKFVKANLSSGSRMKGLTFLIQDAPDDFAFTELHNNAFQIKVANGHQHFDLQSTTSYIITINQNTTALIGLRPVIYGASDVIRHLLPENRLCYFEDEGKAVLKSTYYSYDECVIVCRMNNLKENCGCVNAGMPGTIINATECDILNFACLINWKYNWYRPFLEANNTRPNRCNHCLYGCSFIRWNNYFAETYTRPYDIRHQGNLIRLHIYNYKMFAEAFTLNTVSSLVAILNRFAGILSLMYGFSVMCLIEFFYFFTGRGNGLVKYLWSQVKQKFNTMKLLKRNKINNSIKPTYEKPLNELYWQEFQHYRNKNIEWQKKINENRFKKT